VGVPDEKWGEAPLAVLVMRPGTEPLTLPSLREHLAHLLASYKHPKAVQVLEEMPRNASGKIIKSQLRSVADLPRA
jgi:acyl-CoA synthetase (AMP-forming)/AMP-acid ligase II